MQLHFTPEKNAITKDTPMAGLIKLNSPAKLKNNKRAKLNISFVIDISGSMNDIVDYGKVITPPLPQEPWDGRKGGPMPQWPWGGIPAIPGPRLGGAINNWPEQGSWRGARTKLDKVKEAMLTAIAQLKEDDIFSIVAFHDIVETVMESVPASAANKIVATSRINALHVKGSTDLHSGWLEGAKLVANNLNVEKMNRVILLTDGEANRGETRVDVIVSDVSNLLKNKISTTTFGVGDRFNEELLTQMAENGQGNFYYIETEFTHFFEEEFAGLVNAYAQNIKIKINLNKDVEAVQLNNFKKDGECWLIPSLAFNKHVDILFSFKYKGNKKTKNIDIGEIEINYLPADSKENVVIKQKLNMDLVSKAKWEKMEANEEATNLKALLEIAKIKEESREYFKRGDLAGGQSFLRTASQSYSSYNSPAVMAATMGLNTLAESSAVESLGMTNKKLMAQSYNTRNSKD